MAKRPDNVGLWLVGAGGGVAATVAIGLEALRRGLSEPLGLVGHLPPFNKLELAGFDRWVVGGHEIRRTTFQAAVRELHEKSGLFTPELLKACGPRLRQYSRAVRAGTVANCGTAVTNLADLPEVKRKRSPQRILRDLTGDIAAFGRRHHCRRVVVVNVASTEPPMPNLKDVRTAAQLARRLGALPASSLYALAAVHAGASYINFTPSVGIDVPAIRSLADEKGTAYMGGDGKTGETLMKAVLAPMFADRNLRVRSWVGHNIFGNRDGIVLDDPRNKKAKTRSKDHLIGEVLGYRPQTLVSIEYIESLGDWKTAWDHVHFAGFLGTEMALQFTWQGCDSILAAPLVIELARFAELAARRGEAGPLSHLACFFKSPMGVKQHRFDRQYQMLLDYAQRASAGRR